MGRSFCNIGHHDIGGHDIGYLQALGQGQSRLLSKLGLGSVSPFGNVGSACFPQLDPGGQSVPGWGRDLVVAGHLPTRGATWAARDRELARAYRKILIRVIDGRPWALADTRYAAQRAAPPSATED